MSLTERQVFLIQSSFEKVAPISETAATLFYGKLFEYDPSLKPLFKNDMKSQGKKLMMTLGTAVKGLSDLDSLVPVLQKLAIKHVEYGVKVEDYTPVGNALLFALSQGLKTDFNQEVKQAWIDLYRVVAEVMRSAAYSNYNATTFQNTKRYNN
ncbi:globin family protein [Alteromonas sp. ASW11-36]|uniref:Globin family protein n=1 Tax=Alteromonas arenosi TaxID=3055817 RepID=A0ABT7SW20_9ALTE|nr:globin family protein [Alteromonas sp. ASW11-36]MDM7860373.1 globin family protein [Alteromonas sp. ASW11-36]